jgi:hypothetical protein
VIGNLVAETPVLRRDEPAVRAALAFLVDAGRPVR